jgi:cobalt-zinc-cadmium efflux system outer membrane protein
MKLRSMSCWRAATRARSALVFTIMVLFASGAHGQSGEPPLTLNDAVTRALDRHPRLQIFQLRQQRLEGLKQTAALSPAWRLEAEVENFAGSGERQGFSASEQTLALSSVIEMGGKRTARMAVIDARTGLVDTERQIEALDLVSQVTQSLIDILATQQRLQLAQDAVDLAETTLRIVRKRATAGATPQAEVLRAKAAKTQAELALARAEQALEAQRVQLAALLGTTSSDFGPVAGGLFQLPAADDFAQLYERARENPVMEAYADEERLKEAELRLARSRGASDLEWRLGARRMAETGDTGLVASVSLPLFAGKRSRGDVAAAQAEFNQVRFRRKDALLRLHAQLYEAYANRQQAIETVGALRDSVIPALTEAIKITQQAYESGRYSYVDWMAAQHELLGAKQSLIEAAASALTYGAVIEQLTAEPLSTAPDTSGQR